MYYESAKVKVDGVLTDVPTIRGIVLDLPLLPKQTVRVKRSFVIGLMDRVEELQKLLGEFEYSSDGFVKRYPDEKQALKILECEE